MEDKKKEDFTKEYNMDLDEENEKRFQSWIQEGIDKYGIDLSADLSVYDLRGYWLNGGWEDEDFRQRKGHAPDTYKKPNHPTFSEESIYSTEETPGGRWVIVGGKEAFLPSSWQFNR